MALSRIRLILHEGLEFDAGVLECVLSTDRPGQLETEVLNAGSSAGAMLSVHECDLALSLGRHAVERACLAGIDELMSWVPAVHPRPEADPYRWLRHCGDLRLVALAGLCLAATQLGVRLQLCGPGALLLSEQLICLHPGVQHWCCTLPIEPPPVSTARASAFRQLEVTLHGCG